jgi:antitoxin VapB
MADGWDFMDIDIKNEKPRKPEGGLAERLLSLGRDCAARLKEPYRTVEHGDLLYDERGLPR